MKAYAKSIYITLPLTFISFIASMSFQFEVFSIDVYWSNVLLGVFGSSLLTFITSAIGYSVERRKTLSNFYIHTMKQLDYLRKYILVYKESTDKKVDFFMRYIEMDRVDFSSVFMDIYFLSDKFKNNKNKNATYVCKKIYEPLNEFSSEVEKYGYSFAVNRSVGGHESKIINGCINHLEEKLICSESNEQPLINKKEIFVETICNNKLVSDITEELNGHYQKLLN